MLQWAIPENFHTYTTDGFLEFRGQGGGGGSSLNWNSEGMGGSLNWSSEGMGKFLDLRFPEGTEKSVFLENANFVDLTGS